MRSAGTTLDRLASMAVFARVVEAKSFSAAARQLGLSKSAVSKHVARLEELLGARLLQRTTRRLALTETGTVFHAHCLRVVAEAEEAEAAVTNLTASPRGFLRISLPMTFGRMHVAPLLPEFMARYPDVTIEVALNDRVVDLVEEGFDVAIRIASMPDSSLVARKLAICRFVVCAAPSYLAAHGEPETPQDLVRHNCLGYTHTPTSMDQWVFDGPSGLQSIKVSHNLIGNNGEMLREACIAGIGIIRSPSFIVGDALADGRLKPLLCDFAVPPLSINAVYPSRRHLTPKVRAFIDYFAEAYAGEPAWDCWFTRTPFKHERKKVSA
jgi:DNA-binding transcriptional LysR family regulator